MRKINTLVLVLVLLVTSIPVVIYADTPVKEVTIGSISCNGIPGIMTTDDIVVLFDTDNTEIGLTMTDVTLTGATLDSITTNGTKGYSFAISNITIASGDNVTLEFSKAGFNFTPNTKEVMVYKVAPPVNTGINWGADITESVSGNTLTLIGTGPMNDFGSNDNKSVLKDLGIKEVVIGNGITTIGNNAFHTNNLISVVIPASATSIGANAFAYSDLTSVVIPDGITSIGAGAFFDNNLTSVTFGDSVTHIETGAFYSNNLTSIILPDSMESISASAFYGSHLSSITISDSVVITSSSLGVYANSFKIYYDSVANAAGTYEYANGSWTKEGAVDTTAYDAKVAEANALEETEYTSESWGAYTTSMSAVNLTLTSENTQEELDAEVVKIQAALDLLVVKPTTGVTWGDNITESIDGNVLTLSGTGPMNDFVGGDNDELTSIHGIKEVVIGNGIISIGNYAFSYNDLTSVTIGTSVTSIGDYVFYDNELTSVEIPDSVTTIGEYSFHNNKLTSVTIPNSVTSIGDYAFNSNDDLTSATIGDSVITIGAYSFRDNKLTSITIPDSVTTIGEGAFVDSALTSVTIPNSVTTIGAEAFLTNKLNTVTISNSVTSLGVAVFADNQLTSVTIPDSVTTIDSYAFTANELTSITIGQDVTINRVDEEHENVESTMGSNIGFEDFYISESKVAGTYEYIDGSWTKTVPPVSTGITWGDNITENVNGNVLTLSGTGEMAHFNIDENKEKLINLGITNVFIESGITTIGTLAFQGSDLTSVALPNSVTNIGNMAFKSNKLEAIVISESVAVIGYNAFDDNLLTSITIPNSVEDIGESTFFNNNLTSITMERSDTNLDDSLLHTDNNNFRSAYGLGGIGTYTGTQTGAWTKEVQIDITSPILTSGAISRTSNTTGTVKFTSDETGTYYYEVVADGATAPIINTTGAGITCTTAETTIANPTGLTAGAKDIYILVKDDVGNVSNPLKMDIPNYTPPNSGGSSGGGSSSGSSSNEPVTPQPPKDEPVIVIVNGEEQNAGKETKTSENGQSIVTITVDNKTVEDKVDEVIKNNKTGAINSIQVPVTDTTSDIAKVELTGDIIKKLENNSFNVSVKRDMVEYVIPAEEFAISSVAKNLDVLESNLVDIKLEVQITTLDEAVVEKFNDVAKANGSEIVFPPVSFEVVAKTTKADGTTGEVFISKFNNYVQRVMEIPEGVDPKTVTTGVVFNQDGTYSHVPTTVYQKDGKWFASLNSLTNSNYSIIWNQVIVESVENHWSKESVNDMASRLVIFEPEKFEPNKAITRADFAEYLVRALGIYREDSIYENKFKDVTSSGDRTLAILIANEYEIVSGYTDGTFRPNASISREEAMTMYQRAMKMTKITGDDSNLYQNYKDFETVSPWAESYVKEVLSAHVFNGTTATTISPKSNLTYAEAAQAIKNLLVESKLIND